MQTSYRNVCTFNLTMISLHIALYLYNIYCTMQSKHNYTRDLTTRDLGGQCDLQGGPSE